jgi:hypothetical protein
MMQGNFIGNASSTVVRREALKSVGGYDATLCARGGEGCEDWALHVALAERWDFAVVPRLLVGYRRHAASVSQDGARMARSHALVHSDLRRCRPDLPAYWFGGGLAEWHAGRLVATLRAGEWRGAAEVLARARQDGGWCLVDLLTRRLPIWAVALPVASVAMDRAADGPAHLGRGLAEEDRGRSGLAGRPCRRLPVRRYVAAARSGPLAGRRHPPASHG